ncbi:MAG TPA: DNA repair protein RadA [Elusimicrobiota bacterium]|nr:DNA repair protein RadA [Elusimicrobiota bacterium]
MGRLKSIYRCQECGYSDPKGMGQCPTCSAWNTMVEEVVESSPAKAERRRLAEGAASAVLTLSEVRAETEVRTPTGIAELDRLFGGGVVQGQVSLLAGPPGIGKSTLMLQATASLAAPGRKILYVSGEESPLQVSSRAKRIAAAADSLYLLAETDLAKILRAMEDLKPWGVVLDSIQTLSHPDLASAPGSVGQVRECAMEIVRAAKASGAAAFVLGHVTKDGALAGPKVLEHLVDSVFYFDAERHELLRVLRAVKNRFGPTDETGLFEMTERGLRGVPNPSAFFMAESKDAGPRPGRAVSVTMEGSRPVLVEVQALAVPTRYPLPRRTATGVDLNRVLVLLAALEKHLKLRLDARDVYVSLAGGLRVKDPALDLAVCLAVASSLREAPLPEDAVFLGEVSLLGGVGRVPRTENRLREAAKAGFSRALVGARAAKDIARIPGLEVSGAASLAEAAGLFFSNTKEPLS